MDLTTQTPAQIDTALAAIYVEIEKARFDLDRYRDDQRLYAGKVLGLPFRKTATLAQVEEVKDLIAAEGETDWNRQQFVRMTEAVEKAQAALVKALAKTEPFDAEFERRGGWTRAFLVNNTNGHVHRSMHCSTCFPTTRYAWLTEYSGRNEAEVVEDAGERACTVCYPSAPVEVLSRPTKIFSEDEKAAQKAREEREAAKVARDSKKVANALTMDGSEARIEYGTGKYDYETFKTAQAAQQWVTGHMADWGMSHPDSKGWMTAAAQIVGMLAEKRGQSEAEVLEEISKKALAKVKRDKGDESAVQGVHHCVGFVQAALGL